ncbi:NELL2-interacting cell ontogeny regulator 1-like [Pelobates fuscus]|uniref:NELL2-interacting cell ontogeny regulator 1-like n=1 Tax=Pelobates fuscus TaxID=191477 RepID=UPI002FE47E44
MAYLGNILFLCWIIVGTSVFASMTVKNDESRPGSGSVIPAETRPCVDCHAFEFMQRALQDLEKAAYSLDSRTETLLLDTEMRALCDCLSQRP